MYCLASSMTNVPINISARITAAAPIISALAVSANSKGVDMAFNPHKVFG